MRSCRARNRCSSAVSLLVFCETVMSTMLPDEMLGGRRMEGNSIWARTRQLRPRRETTVVTRRLSGVRRTVTPASTFPTVRETSIMRRRHGPDCVRA